MNDYRRSVPYAGLYEADGLYEYEGFDSSLEMEWLGEVNRRSAAYVRWVQQALNRIVGAGLAVDGISGRQTRAAVRRFQRQAGLQTDGVVGARTERALVAAGAGAPPGGAAGTPTRPPAPAPGSFRLVPVESPGGGRIKDKRDPHPSNITTVTGTGRRQIPLQRHAAQAWRAMVAAARADGIAHPLLLPTSGYRSRARQEKLWRNALRKYGSTQVARRWVAPPGGSAHQSGRAIDLYLGGRNSSSNVSNLRRTRAYKWLVSNARRFGFYPYQREPWHWEYNPPATAREAEADFEFGC